MATGDKIQKWIGDALKTHVDLMRHRPYVFLPAIVLFPVMWVALNDLADIIVPKIEAMMPAWLYGLWLFGAMVTSAWQALLLIDKLIRLQKDKD